MSEEEEAINWRVRRGTRVKTFSDGLVVQGRVPGVLDLSVYLLTGEEEGSNAERIGFLSPIATAATSEAIRKDTGIVSWLDWPDIVTIGGRAVGKTTLSILPSTEGGATDDAGIIIGILVNCFADKSRFAYPVGLPQSSILDALGVEIDMDLLREKVLQALEWYFAEWRRGVHRKLAERIIPTIPWLGADVIAKLRDGRELRGRAKGIGDLGSLVLLEEGPQDRRVRTLRVRPELVDHVSLAR